MYVVRVCVRACMMHMCSKCVCVCMSVLACIKVCVPGPETDRTTFKTQFQQ